MAGRVSRVLHIFSGDLWAGAEVMVFNLLSRQARDPGLRVEALALNEGVLARKLREEGVEVRVIPEGESSFPVLLARAYRLLRRKRFEVIHAHRYKENLLASLLAMALGSPRLVATVHGLPEPSPGNGRGRGAAVRLNEFLLRRRFSKVVAVSREMRQVLVGRHRLDPRKVEVAHNGIPLPSAPPPAGEPTRAGGVRIGAVGRLVPVKDHHLFLEAAAEIRKRDDRVRFAILGNGPLEESLKSKAAALHLGDRLEILPPVADPFPFYRSLDIFLNTSLHEGLPLSLLEAMACRKPVVAPRLGGIPEVITNGVHGLTFEGREPEGLARLCLGLIGKPRLRAEMGEQAFQRVSTSFTASRMAERYREIYQ